MAYTAITLDVSTFSRLLCNITPNSEYIGDILIYLQEKKQKTNGSCDKDFLTISITFWTQLYMIFQIQESNKSESKNNLWEINMKRVNQHYKEIKRFLDKYPTVYVCQCGKVCANVFEARASLALKLCDCSK
jgi:hypothetical protein